MTSQIYTTTNFTHLYSIPSTQKYRHTTILAKLIFLTSYTQGEASGDNSRTATTTTARLKAEATLDVLCPVFEDHVISWGADVFWLPRSCDLTLLDYYLWGAVKGQCYAYKPETIDPLKDNIRDAVGEIQLHIIDNVPKNWNDRVVTAWPVEPDI